MPAAAGQLLSEKLLSGLASSQRPCGPEEEAQQLNSFKLNSSTGEVETCLDG
jgi:hypothetical protein